MSKILILHFHSHKTQPRAYREYEALWGLYELEGMGYERGDFEEVEFVTLKKPKWGLAKRLLQRFWLLLRQYERVYWNLPQVKQAIPVLHERSFDLIIAHDAEAIPVALRYGKGAKVVANMHEYAPREFEHDFWWRFYFAPYKRYLCKRYLPKTRAVLAIGEGIAHEYQKNFGVNPKIWSNAAKYFEIKPALASGSTIRLIHHGLANPDRQIELMIEMMDHVDGRFRLDLMLVFVNSNKAYYQKLEKMARERQNVRLIPPVAPEEIVPFTNAYDIGLFLCPPTTFNLEFCLPNKFFEFIQARLAIAIGPSPEMARIVQKENLGIISQDFTPLSMARALNQLTHEEILAYKQNADRAAKIYNAKENEKILQGVIEKVLKEDQ
ncbi:glycosyltransferase [Wolinella succinogenes]|uniref:glycosyltransferase n=1 Tax=Wolinella succinogenes TaxID=844 RepID=UPI00240A562B|nr:glycosyltransferase [Wolinella succinogenes]